MDIGWHKYARLRTIFDFMTELKFQKKSNLIFGTPRVLFKVLLKGNLKYF